MRYNRSVDSVPMHWAKDQVRLELLWEAGCCVTIQMRLCPEKVDWLLTCHKASESVKALGSAAKLVSDTFLKFCYMVKDLHVDSPADGLTHSLSFNNSPYNSSMHKAATSLLSIMRSSTSSPSFEDAMCRLELKFGRELLSNAYSKLVRLVALAKKASSPERPAHEVAAWLVDMLHLALNTHLLSTSKATEAVLDKDRKHGTQGYWPACLVVLDAQLMI